MDAHDLNIDPTAWWWILLAGIAFIVGGLAVALNRIQERRPPGWKDATMAPGPEGAGKSQSMSTTEKRKGPELGMEDMLLALDPSSGNADGLTRMQVGIGWRLADHSEEPHPDAQVWEPYYKSWARRMFNASKPYERTCTYRVPIKGKD